MLATDDRAARALAAEAGVAVCGTPDLVKRWADGADANVADIGAALLCMKRRARYLPAQRDPLYQWWMARLPDAG